MEHIQHKDESNVKCCISCFVIYQWMMAMPSMKDGWREAGPKAVLGSVETGPLLEKKNRDHERFSFTFAKGSGLSAVREGWIE